jgi:hypothetical protein
MEEIVRQVGHLPEMGVQCSDTGVSTAAHYYYL